MTFNLQMVNTWIALCRGAPGMPPDIFDLGFREKAIEQSFSVSPTRVVNPELTATSESLDHCLLIESKSGANIDVEQAIRYKGVTHSALYRDARLPRRGTATHDVIYVGEEAHKDRLAQGLAEAGASFPLLLKTDQGLALARNQFAKAELQAVFEPALAIDWQIVPRDYVPLDGDSELWEVAEAVMPQAFIQLEKRAPDIDLDELSSAIYPSWRFLGPRGRDPIRAKIAQVFQAASENHFAGIFAPYSPGHWTRIRIHGNPHRSMSRQKAWHDLAGRQERFLRMLQGQDPRQLVMLNEDV